MKYKNILLFVSSSFFVMVQSIDFVDTDSTIIECGIKKAAKIVRCAFNPKLLLSLSMIGATGYMCYTGTIYFEYLFKKDFNKVHNYYAKESKDQGEQLHTIFSKSQQVSNTLPIISQHQKNSFNLSQQAVDNAIEQERAMKDQLDELREVYIQFLNNQDLNRQYDIQNTQQLKGDIHALQLSQQESSLLDTLLAQYHYNEAQVGSRR